MRDRLLYIHLVWTVGMVGFCAWAVHVTPWTPLAFAPVVIASGLIALLGVHGYYFTRSRQGAPKLVI